MEEAPSKNQTVNEEIKMPEKKSGMMGIIIILLSIVAVGGVGFGVYEFANNKTLQTKNDELQNTIKKYELSNSSKEEIKENIETTENTEDSDSYLAIEEWGIKIKMPNTLKYIDYDFYAPQNSENEEVFILAAKNEYENIPDFANKEKNPNGLMMLIKTPKSTPHNYENVVFEFGDYIIVYDYVRSIENFKDAQESTELLIDVISNSNNYSKL